MGVEEEAEPRREGVDGEPCGRGGLNIGEAIGERECQLLSSRRTCFSDVVAGDGHRVPSRHFGRGKGDDIGDKAHRWTRGEHVFLLRLILLEDVVLQRPA